MGGGDPFQAKIEEVPFTRDSVQVDFAAARPLGIRKGAFSTEAGLQHEKSRQRGSLRTRRRPAEQLRSGLVHFASTVQGCPIGARSRAGPVAWPSACCMYSALLTASPPYVEP